MSTLPASTQTLPQQKNGWISQATFESLPERFQRSALELQRRGEIVIGDGQQAQVKAGLNNGNIRA